MTARVLVVDDEQDLAAWMVEALAEAGIVAQATAQAGSAIELIAGNVFDVVVSDIAMPGTSGIELLRAIHSIDPELPVVLVTGKPTVETAMQALELGAVQYLLKPIGVTELIEAVTRAHGLRRMAILRREALNHLARRRRATARRELLSVALDRALGTLWMAYQPIHEARSGAVYGFEALLRSEEPGYLHPEPLLKAAERLQRIPEIGRAVRDAVAAAIRSRAVDGTVFVNIHAMDLIDEHLMARGSPLSTLAHQVVLEITERASLEGIPSFRACVRQLRDLGFRIAVDDLGAGYAGLSTFATLEPDIVKLDTSLVQGCHAEPTKQKLVRSLASLGRDLRVLVVAEGVETRQDCDAARSLGCDLLQGFYLGMPEPRIRPAAG